MTPDVVVVGGGVIGLAAAWRLAERDVSVTVLDAAPGTGATRAAAGMLAPVTEVHYGEAPLLALNLESARRWPGFAAELEEVCGAAFGHRREGTVVVASTEDDLRAVEALVEFQERLDLPVERLRRGECRTLEPSLAPGIRGGALVAGDHQVDPRRLVDALLAACRIRGVEFIPAAVTRVLPKARVQLDDGTTIAGATVLVAAGCRSGELAGLPVRPVKGQILRLRGDMTSLLTRNVRGLSRGVSVYLVPRTDGELVVGATVEERGSDTTVTAGAVQELLDAAVGLVPGVAELELREASAGLRPGTPDNAPLIGPARDGVIVATGHFRNGILLAPVTADVIVELVTTGELPPVAVPFAPGRFT